MRERQIHGCERKVFISRNGQADCGTCSYARNGIRSRLKKKVQSYAAPHDWTLESVLRGIYKGWIT